MPTKKHPADVVFGYVLSKHRQRLNMSQEAFADYIGVHRTYVSKLEMGKSRLTVRTASQIAKAIKVPLSKLFKEVEEYKG